MTESDVTVIGIAGGTAAGKSTIAAELAAATGGLHLSMDSYYHGLDHYETDDQTEVKRDEPEAINWSELNLAVQDLKHGREISIPLYSFETARVSGHVDQEPKNPVIVDGVLALHDDSLRSMMDHTIYVELEPDLRLARRLERDIAERGESVDDVLSRYRNWVRPAQVEYVRPSKEHADIVVRGDSDAPVETIMAHIQATRGEI